MDKIIGNDLDPDLYKIQREIEAVLAPFRQFEAVKHLTVSERVAALAAMGEDLDDLRVIIDLKFAADDGAG